MLTLRPTSHCLGEESHSMSAAAEITFEQGLPASPDAERTILGAVLLDNDAYTEAVRKLTSDDFALDSHRRIFARMGELLNSQHAVDIVTLAEVLSRHKEIDAVGGVSYLASLTDGLPRRLSIAEYVRIVHEKALLRKLIHVHSSAVSRAADQSEDPQAILASARAEIEALTTEAVDEGVQLVGDYLRAEFPTAESMIERPSVNKGIPIGIMEFDDLTCGLQRGELSIMAARPSMGKTDWGCNIADHAAVNLRKRVAIFSAEMSKEQIVMRMVCARARVPRDAHKKGTMTDEDRRYFADAREELMDAPLYLDEKGEMTVSYIRHQCLWLKAKAGLDLVVVDYLQFLSSVDIVKHYSREQDVANMSRRLKLLAKDLDAPVVVMAQLSRDNTKRTDKRPILSDLRESGAIEQDADMVGFLHRECYYDPTNEDLKRKGEIIIAKQRNGPVGTVHTGYDPAVGRWGDVPTGRDEEFQW